MADTPRPDDAAARRIRDLEDRLLALEAAGRRRVYAAHESGSTSTTSTAFVDITPAVAAIRPGPSGMLLVGMSAGLLVPPGQIGIVSVHSSMGPTTLAASDNTAIRLDNGAGNPANIAVYASRLFQTDPLADGSYTLTLCLRSVNGGLVTVDTADLIAIPV